MSFRRSVLPTVLSALILVAASGCAATRPVDTTASSELAEINARLVDQSGFIVLLSGERTSARSPEIGRDSVFWMAPGSGGLQSVAVSEVHAVEAPAFRRNPIARRSFAVGGSVGFGLYATAFLIVGDAQADAANVGGFAAASLLGGLIGLLAVPSEDDDRRIGRFILNPMPTL